MKGLYSLDQKIEQVGQSNCYISDITVAELLYGAYHSKNQKHINETRQFINEFTIIPLADFADSFASEKNRLTDIGQLIDDFDIMIGISALKCGCIVVTDNIKHFSRIKDLKVENWIDRSFAITTNK